MDLWLDTEWFPFSQKLFLVGFANSNNVQQYFGRQLTPQNIEKLFLKHKRIFVYGPDIGVLENFTGKPLRKNTTCINVLKMVKHTLIGLPSYRLSEIEKHYGYTRNEGKYKQAIFEIEMDWKDPIRRKYVLQYNKDDVFYFRKITIDLMKRHGITGKHLEPFILS